MIQSTRVQVLCDRPADSHARYVLYWMQSSQRVAYNPALAYAVGEANDLGLPVVVCFGLVGFPEGNLRHYDFMVRGLVEVRDALVERGIAFVIRRGEPDKVALALSKDAALVVCDRGYLAVLRTWRERLAKAIERRLVQVEGEVVVPVETASPKHEYAARTLRPKLHRVWEDYLHEMRLPTVKHRADRLGLKGDVELDDAPGVLAKLKLDTSVGAVKRFKPGERAAHKRLDAFIDRALGRYGADRGRPEAEAASHMSPYLHFGMISPLQIALRVRAAKAGGAEDRAAYLEELIVRRELSMNHVFYARDYDRYACNPNWARETLAAHAKDPRPHLYTRRQFEQAETHDPYWNAAMREMTATGYMHNHLRMYWAKKMLQWSKDPEEAFETILTLNNRWFIDGRDPNSFTNVAWIFGLHDRPWGAQPVFGTVRSMGPNTFKKFDADVYVASVDALVDAEGAR